MKRLGFAIALVLSLSVAGAALAADPAGKAAPAPAAAAKAGDTLYVCGCGASCPCQTVQSGPGKCHCGQDLLKATVTKVDGDKLTVKLPSGAEQVVKAPKK